jgi:hypothetical protein
MDCDVLPEDNAGRKNRYQNDEDYPPCPGTEERYRVAHRLGPGPRKSRTASAGGGVGWSGSPEIQTWRRK